MKNLKCDLGGALATPSRHVLYRDETPFKGNINKAYKRAKDAGVPFEINTAWARKTYTGFCSLTGIEFKSTRYTKSGHPLGPSIDRINPELGYIPENCRWVLWCINALKGIGDDLMILQVAEVLVKNRDKILKNVSYENPLCRFPLTT